MRNRLGISFVGADGKVGVGNGMMYATSLWGSLA